jgi:outer membrane protein OmpA-like peptidoglycan-associated protein
MRMVMSLAFLCWMLVAVVSAEPAQRIPLVPGLTVVTAISDRQGDYESIKRIESANSGSLRLKYSSELPKPHDLLDAGDDSQPRPTVSYAVQRTILRKDLVDSHNYLQQFQPQPLIPETFPGATAIGVSSAVLNELKTKGESGLIVYQTVLPPYVLKVDRQPGEADYRLGGILKRVEPGSVSVPVIVNGKLTRLPAIHAKGLLAIEQSEFYFLDDPQNPLTLRFNIGKASLTVIKINFPGGDEPVNGALGQAAASTPSAQSGEHIERSLASKGRAEVYGIYFSLGSDRIRPESAPVLKDIADALNQHSAWKLNVEGHTDNVGGNAYNQDLSVRRSAAVKRALVERYHISPGRLGTAGFGASRPKATNDTLEGRALNRRVELVQRGES